MTDTMIERAAEAMCNSVGNVPWARMSEHGRGYYRDAVRAALQSLRSATDADIDRAAGRALDRSVGTGQLWQDMIDAALSHDEVKG